jgi:hypothetical protein
MTKPRFAIKRKKVTIVLVVFVGLFMGTILAFQNCSSGLSSQSSNSQNPASSGTLTSSTSSAAGLSPTTSAQVGSVPPPLSASSVPGPFDGIYNVINWTCGSRNLLSLMQNNGAVPTFNISGTSGTEVLSYPVSLGTNSCVSTSQLSLNYSSNNIVSITVGATSCTGATCDGRCSASVGSNTALAYAYSKNSNGLTLSYSLTASDVANSQLIFGSLGCQAGDSVNMLLSVQGSIAKNTLDNLKGLWTGPCVSNAVNNGSTQVSFQFDGHGLDVQSGYAVSDNEGFFVSTFPTKDCSGNADVNFFVNSSYYLQGPSAAVSGATNINMASATASTFYLFGTTSAASTLISTNSQCQALRNGVSNANLNYALPLNCLQALGVNSSQVSAATSGIYQISGNTLYFGVPGDTTLDTGTAFNLTP